MSALCIHTHNNTLSLMMLKHRSPRVTPSAETHLHLLEGSGPSMRLRENTPRSQFSHSQALHAYPHASTQMPSFNPQSILIPHSSLLEKITQNLKSLMRQSQGVMPPLAASATTGVKMVVHPSSERLATFTMSQTECIAAAVACPPRIRAPNSIMTQTE